MSEIRALAHQLAGMGDGELRGLFTARPDLILPPVRDFAALAARASSRVGLQRAVENVTRPQLQLLEAVVVLDGDDDGPVTLERLEGAFADGLPHPLEALVAPLLERVLIVGSGREGFTPVGALPEVLGPYPAGLGRSLTTLAGSLPRYGAALIRAAALVDPAVATRTLTRTAAAGVLENVMQDPALWDRLMSSAPEGAGAVLSRLRAAPVGSTAAAGGAGTASAVQWLVDRCLLAPLDAVHVELPRSVGIALRDHAVFTSLESTPPVAVDRTTRITLRDNAALSAIAETLRLVSALLATVSASPVTTLRSGGVGVRELKRVRERLAVGDAEAAWLLELTAAVGLLALDPDDSRWKTAHRDAWERLDRGAQWLLLVQGWLTLDRAPALVGSSLPDGTSINALAAGASRPDAPMVRRRMLAVTVALSASDPVEEAPADDPPAGSGSASVPVLTEARVIALATWYQPRLTRRLTRLLPGMLGEAAALGLTGGGALTDAGRAIAEGRFDEAAHGVGSALPEPVAHVVLQADLTAVAPGYLQPGLARALLRVATPEGQGPATIYRFSADSIRSALDAGEDAASIIAFLGRHAATAVPQALTYLIEDTASRHRGMQVGRAGSYVRIEDEAIVAAVLADPRAARIGVHQLAPTVLVSPGSPQELTTLLRDLGFAPAIETAPAAESTPVREPDSTASVLMPADRLRARLDPWSVGEEEIAHQLTSLRSSRRGPGEGAAPAEDVVVGLETLRSAIRSRRRVRLGTADSRGNHELQVLVPLSVSGGRLRVFDPQRQVEKVVSVHRIMDVEILEGSPADG
ncbi:hypothetical protein E8P82_06965 [Arthrobacter echini]|uniref:Helicase XPB/Ssl2 N-terminal domain-containing protein n=1 Tax=Arthrobacter echini TaxID=1529066 RepID=A0A4S5E5H1_9MICC|nr:helicase-associated domain-containing protein [Arthrobacter echini]THJ66682.1 hypothetical protein E8P82_06965 [Arthrobacter echini]